MTDTEIEISEFSEGNNNNIDLKEDNDNSYNDNEREDQNVDVRLKKYQWEAMKNISQNARAINDVLSNVKIIDGLPFFSGLNSDEEELRTIGVNFEYAFTGKMPQENEKNGNKKNTKNGSKKESVEQIRLKNSLKHINEAIDRINGQFDINKRNWNFDSHILITHDAYELRGYIFVKIMQYFTYYYNNTLEEKANEIVMVVYKFLNDIENNKIFSLFLKNIIEQEFSKLKIKINFDPINMVNKFPRLTVYNNYDYLLPKSKGITPFDHQIQVLTEIMKNFDTGFLIKNIVMAGYGKTSTIIPLGKIFQDLNKNSKFSKKRIRLVFAINTESVRLEVGKLLFHAGITFGIVGHRNQDKNTKKWFVATHPSSKETKPTVLITSPEYALSVIESLETKGDTVVLFFDEPTIGADNSSSCFIKENAKLLANLPKRTILSSATFPEDESTKCIFEIHKLNFPKSNHKIPTITCTDVKIGCKIYTYDYKNFPIYFGITNVNELVQFASSLKTNPFLKKLCTLEILYDLQNLMKQHNIKTNFSWETWTNNLTNLNPNSISNCVADLLLEFKSLPNHKINAIFNTERKVYPELIKFDELLESGTSMFDGMSLIATKDPIKFAEHNFESFLKKVTQSFDIHQALAIYDKEVNEYQESVKAIEKEEEAANKKAKVISEDGKIKDKEMTGDSSKSKDLIQPSFYFPDYFHINSEQHCRRTGKKCNHRTHQQFFPSAISLTYDGKYRMAEIHFDADLVMLLMCGIGICSKNIKNTHYKDFVLELASQGKLAYVIADESISYGTNYPFTRVFITDDFANSHSMETVMQVIARGGRLGLSYEASAFIPQSLIPRFKSYIKDGKDFLFNEGKNIAKQIMIEYEKININKWIEQSNKSINFYCNVITKIFETCVNDFNNLKSEMKNKSKVLNIGQEKNKNSTIEINGTTNNKTKNLKQQPKTNDKQEKNIGVATQDDWDNFMEETINEQKEIQQNEQEEKKIHFEHNTYPDKKTHLENKFCNWRTELSDATKSTASISSSMQAKDENLRNAIFGSNIQNTTNISSQNNTGKYIPPSRR